MKNALITLRNISLQLESEASHGKQMEIVVSSVCNAMNVPVCSLYAVDKDELILVATKGLNQLSVGNVRMKINQGLVGHTAVGRHPVNVEDAVKHEKFLHFPEINEEEFHAFLGVPIIYRGELSGVLVAQDRQSRRFTDEEEAFLVTVSSHLVPILSAKEILSKVKSKSNICLKGVKGAAGIGIGLIQFIESPNLQHAEEKKITDVEKELDHFFSALEQTKQEMQENEKAFASSVPADIFGLFSIYRMILDDKELIEEIIEEIKNGLWSASALKRVINKYLALFENMEDEYLKARSEDLKILGNKLYCKLISKNEISTNFDGGIILAGDLISIIEIARFSPNKLSGIICSSGSRLSHTAVLAHALGIPAVMGVDELKFVSNGMMTVIDGYQGQVILNPTKSIIKEYEENLKHERQLHNQLEKLRDLPAVTRDGVRVSLFTNTGLLADLSPGLLQGAEGIGLYRTEIPFMVHENFPTEDEQYRIYYEVLKSYQNKPVYMRTLDIGGDKQLPYYAINEKNPALGWRGIRFSLDNTSIFMTQIRAMLRASVGLDNLHIILPMVSRVDELTRFRELLNDASGQLKYEGFLIKTPAIGIMVEIPGIISLLPFMADQLDFVSIGSNDLSQYLLAVDRDNPRVSHMYDNLNPAIIHEINRIVGIARLYDIDVSLCGEMASDPIVVPLLVGMGLRTLSVSAYNLPIIKHILCEIDTNTAEEILGQALAMDDEATIRVMVTKRLEAIGLKEFLKVKF